MLFALERFRRWEKSTIQFQYFTFSWLNKSNYMHNKIIFFHQYIRIEVYTGNIKIYKTLYEFFMYFGINPLQSMKSNENTKKEIHYIYDTYIFSFTHKSILVFLFELSNVCTWKWSDFFTVHSFITSWNLTLPMSIFLHVRMYWYCIQWTLSLPFYFFPR